MNDKEFLASYRAMFENKSYDPGMNLLADLRKTDSSPRGRHILENLAHYVKQKYASRSRYPKIAVIAPQDLSFGLARMYEGFAGPIPWEFAVFRTKKEALTWLGMSEDILPKELKSLEQIPT